MVLFGEFPLFLTVFCETEPLGGLLLLLRVNVAGINCMSKSKAIHLFLRLWHSKFYMTAYMSGFPGYALALDMSSNDLQSASKVPTKSCSFLLFFSLVPPVLFYCYFLPFLVVFETLSIDRVTYENKLSKNIYRSLRILSFPVIRSRNMDIWPA